MDQLTPTSVIQSTSGFRLPVFGLGTWQCKGDDLEKALNAALEAGYRLIDTAYGYYNEDVIGKVLNQWFSSGKLKREEIFITTKLTSQANKPELVREMLGKQLKALQLEYVDLYLIHYPVGTIPTEVKFNSDGTIDLTSIKLDMATDHLALWKEMEKVYDAGITKAIGISNFNSSQIERIMKNARILPVNLQTEMYLYNQIKPLREFCKNKGITITSFGNLGSLGIPKGMVNGAELNPLDDPVVVRIAETHGKTPAQVLLRHMMQLGVAVIPKTANPDRVRQNVQVFDFKLSPSEMAELNNLDKGEEGRRFVFNVLKAHPEYPHPK